MTNEQLELGIAGVRTPVSARRRRSRAHRAAWWFAHMRRIVDNAIDWSAAQPARPEQLWTDMAEHKHAA